MPVRVFGASVAGRRTLLLYGAVGMSCGMLGAASLGGSAEKRRTLTLASASRMHLRARSAHVSYFVETHVHVPDMRTTRFAAQPSHADIRAPPRNTQALCLFAGEGDDGELAGWAGTLTIVFVIGFIINFAYSWGPICWVRHIAVSTPRRSKACNALIPHATSRHARWGRS